MGRKETLSLLRSGEWISGEEVALRQGISRAAVWKQIQSLRRVGYDISASTKKGYRLANEPDLLDEEIIRFGLKTEWLGKDIHVIHETASTNVLAKEMAPGSKNGTVIIAEVQTQGRGRLSRPWTSPLGGVWMSIILKPTMPLGLVYQINMAASVAISKSIQTLYGLEAGIKWPNDILIDELKVCGILMEVSAEVDRLDYALVGIGINANIDVSEFPIEWKSTSISRQLGHSVDRVVLIREILYEIENAFEKIGSDKIYEEWRRRSATLGKCVRIQSIAGDLKGVAEDLLNDGTICIKTSEGQKRVLAGDCIHLRLWRGHED